jgi:hypothetical protein
MVKFARLIFLCCAVFCCAVFMLFAWPQPKATAQVCTSNAGCAGTLVCDRAFLGLIGSCRLALCNTNADCAVTRRATTCVSGVCHATCTTDAGCPIGFECNRVPGRTVSACFATSGSGSGSGSGTPIAGEGQACGPREFGGGVIKNVGCARGLQCQNRRCIRPAQ